MIVTDDDDSVRGAARLESAAAKAPAPAKPRFRETGSSWHTVGQAAASTDSVSELLDAEAGGEDGPAIAEGADLVREYQAQQREKEEGEARQRSEQRRAWKQQQQQQQQEAQLAEQSGTAGAPVRTSRSPSPAPMRHGLLTAAAAKEDADRAHERDMRRLRELGDDVSGRNAGTVYRDAATGKQIDVEEARREAQDRTRQRETLRAQHAEWNKGLVQQRDKLEDQQRVERLRLHPDAEADRRGALDAEQRARQHWNDPALRFLENKRPEKHTYPVYQGYAPPNRFGIRPGYRWDGVDRSNGFERDLFKQQAAASAQRSAAYANAVADW
ncbi:Pre-mRNA-splicing factor cwc26 [Coemansia nantahalensis]|nr:Pre-mRNA-splicing factor cwc26 [Coemansia nantahalensis]